MNRFHNIPNTEVIDDSGNKYWISPSISVDALVIVIPRILVIKRSTAPDVSNPTKWCLPCGFMDWNETPLNACMRELHEETGVDVREQDILNADYTRPYSLNGTALQFKFVLPLLPEVEINIEECTEYKWVTLDELDTLEWAFGHDMLIQLLMQEV